MSPGDVARPAAGGPAGSAAIRFELDGRPVDARPGESILQAAERHGVRIPHLCYMEGMRPDGNCRACVVEIEGERVLAQYGCFIGSAAIVVLSQHDRARDAALNLMRFFAHESCGKCTPCRAGTAKSVELMARPTWDVGLLKELGGAMMDASICGLGQAAPNPVRSVINYFPQELES